MPELITSDFLYCPLRKPEYTPEDRQTTAINVKKLLENGKDVFVFFKHEETPAEALYVGELFRRLVSCPGNTS